MFVALLFDECDQLLAAAPGCDQQPMGDKYWRDIYPQELPTAIGQTSVVKINSNELVHLLLGLANFPETLDQCRQQLAAYERRQSPQDRPMHSKAA